MSDVILKDLETRLETALVTVKKDLATVRTGRAKPSLVEEVKWEGVFAPNLEGLGPRPEGYLSDNAGV